VVFHGVSATDGCGRRGSSHGPITLAFAPGELSTVEGEFGADDRFLQTKPFDFADLPCPPQSVMEADWYTYGPGKPYRPVLSLPQKLLNFNPEWNGCVAGIFQGIDPPKALVPASALDPATTKGDPPAIPTPATPSWVPQAPPAITSVVSNGRSAVAPVTSTLQSIPPELKSPLPSPEDPSAHSPGPADHSPSVGGDPNASTYGDSRIQPQQVDQPNSSQHQTSQHQTSQHQTNQPAQDPPAQNPPAQGQHGVTSAAVWVPAIAIQSHTIVQGAPGVLISGLTVKYSSGSIYVGNNAAPISVISQPQQQQQQNADPAVIDGLSFTPVQQSGQAATSAPAVIVSGQTLSNNGPAATINGIVVVYSSSSIHVGTNVSPAPTVAPEQQQQHGDSHPAAVIGGLTFAPVRQVSQAVTDNPAVIVKGQALTENAAPITIDGNVVAYSSGSIHVGTNAGPAPTPAPQQQQDGPTPQVVEGFTFTPLLVPNIQATVTPITVGGQTVSFDDFGARIGTNLVLPGAAPTTISETRVSLGSGGLVVGGQTYAASRWSTPAAAGGSRIATIDGQTISFGPAGAIAIGSTTLTPGAPPITLSGTRLSLGAAGLVIGSSTIPLTSTPSQSVFTVAGNTFTVNPTGFSIAGSSISEGGPRITIAGTPVSLGPSGLVIGSSTIPLPSPSGQSIFTIAETTFTANPTGFSIDGTSIYEGGSGITIAGTPVSFGPSGLVIGSSTIPLAPTQLVFTIAGTTFTANPTGFFIAGTSISKGVPGITISATPISLGPSGLVIGSSTIALTPTQSIFTIAGVTFTANPTGFSIAGTPISEGGPGITISGTPVSLGPSGLVIGTRTIALSPTTTAGGAGLGGVILSGLGPIGPSPTSTATSSPEPFAGGAGAKMEVPTSGLMVWGLTAVCMLWGALVL